MAEQGTNLVQLKNTLNMPNVKKKFEDMLGKRAPQFMTSITSVVSQSALLQKADVNSIVMGAAVAASMDLPLHPNLGYAALVPYMKLLDYKGMMCVYVARSDDYSQLMGLRDELPEPLRDIWIYN